jgi:hypothetical protein
MQLILVSLPIRTKKFGMTYSSSLHGGTTVSIVYTLCMVGPLTFYTLR